MAGAVEVFSQLSLCFHVFMSLTVLLLHCCLVVAADSKLCTVCDLLAYLLNVDGLVLTTITML